MVAGGFFAIACGALFIVCDGLVDENEPSQLGVVLGSKVMPSGVPSPSLEARLREALAGYRRGLYPRIFVSGGFGKEGHDEALVMRDWLVGRGVPADRVIADQNGDNTFMTALHAGHYADEHSLQSATVITQYFHITRSKYFCREAGIAEVHGRAPFHFAFKDVYSIPREFVAIVAHWCGLKR